MLTDPFSMSATEMRTRFHFEMGMRMAISNPLAQVKLSGVTSNVPRRLLICDPAERWARSIQEFLGQLRDVFLHEFWSAAGRPERSPGAAWV